MAFLALLVVASYPEVFSRAVPNQSNPYGVTVPDNSTTHPIPAQSTTAQSPFSCSSCSDGYYCKDNACHLCTAASIIDCPLTDITQCTNMADTYCNCGYNMYFDYVSKMCHGCSDCSLGQVKIPCTANQDTRCEAQTTMTRHTTMKSGATKTASQLTTTMTFDGMKPRSLTTVAQPSATFPIAVTPIHSFQLTVPMVTSKQPEVSTSTSAQDVSQDFLSKQTEHDMSSTTNSLPTSYWLSHRSMSSSFLNSVPQPTIPKNILQLTEPPTARMLTEARNIWISHLRGDKDRKPVTSSSDINLLIAVLLVVMGVIVVLVGILGLITKFKCTAKWWARGSYTIELYKSEDFAKQLVV